MIKKEQTILVKLNPLPLPSIDTPLLSKEHLETTRLDDQAIVNNMTVLPANVLRKSWIGNLIIRIIVKYYIYIKKKGV